MSALLKHEQIDIYKTLKPGLVNKMLIGDAVKDTKQATRTNANLPVCNSIQNYGRVLEVSHLLHSSLLPEQILELFIVEVSKDVHLDGLLFTNNNEELDIRIGISARHCLEYSLALNDVRLGKLQLTRNEPFTNREITVLEEFTSSLIYPMRNAFNYLHAIRSSYQDPLTGVSNRAALEHDLERECALARRSQSPLSILLMDIDHFKKVNDRWGHLYGDSALKTVAGTASKCLRGSDMLYRYGGEEFLILLANTSSESAMLVAERIRSNIEATELSCDNLTFNITASIGIATLNETDNSNSLIHRADSGLYQAKCDGRNQVRFTK